MKFTLKSERTLSIALHDLSGSLVSMLAEGVHRGAGEGQIAFMLSNVPAGMYLITVTTDQNEKIIQRLIVQ